VLKELIDRCILKAQPDTEGERAASTITAAKIAAGTITASQLSDTGATCGFSAEDIDNAPEVEVEELGRDE
jgi:hypothetical protein